MIDNISFPVHHISVRVPWHDSDWNGAVCADPKNNSACLKLRRIASNKDEADETTLAGKHFGDLDENRLPPCLQEGAAFMSAKGSMRTHVHPYSGNAHFAHFAPTPVHYPPYSAPAIPYKWMLKESFHGARDIPPLRDTYPLDGIEERMEPRLGFDPAWWQDRRNQTALLDTFWTHVREEDSLVFFYAKQVPLVEDAPGSRILVGVGRVKSIGGISEYLYRQPMGDLRCVLWERMVHHSIRPHSRDGFLMPYREALEKSRDGDAFDPAEVVAFAPEERFNEFSYATEHVSDDAAIEALMSMRAALGRSKDLFGADVGKQEEWIDIELGRLWRKRGYFPGMGAVLSATGLPMGNFIARALSERAGNDESPWRLCSSCIDNPSGYLQPDLSRRIDRTIAASWKRMSAERREFLELLSRIDLTHQQAMALVTPEVRKQLSIEREDSEFLSNPYLLYEDTRLIGIPVSINAVDRGLLPASSVRTKFPVPERSRVDTLVDARRLRALSIYELERVAAQGDTLMSRESVVTNLRQRDSSDDESPTLATADLLGVAEDTLFAGEIRVVEMSDRKPAYQLERLGKAGDLIRKTVEARIKGKRHNIRADWRRLLDEELSDYVPENESDKEMEDRAREEKAAALAEIANARMSVLIGSAGTGKTTLLSVLCKHPEIRRDEIALLAPTGKARVRLEALTGGDNRAYTIAQFLIPSGGYDGVRYKLTGKRGEMRGRTVIVDECSMLTEEMLAALIESLSDVHRLILVGDPRQLPPIGAGRPFIDIIQRLKRDEIQDGFPRVGDSYAELTVQRRQDTKARGLDGIELAEWFGGEPGPSHDRAFEILSGQRESETVNVVQWESPDELQNSLPQILAEHLGFDKNADEALEFSRSLGGQISGGYAYFNVGRSGKEAEAWQILSPHRQKPWGVETLNRMIHQRYKSGQIESSASGYRFLKPQGDQQVVYGDKVINNRNTRLPKRRKWPEEEGYLANGEIGMVVGQMRKKKFKFSPWEMEVEFSTQQGSVVKFRPGDFGGDDGYADLELAYALTIHKAQGSEFGTVLLILPKSNHMLSRELIYTALTRQTNKIVVLIQGEPADFHRLSSQEHSETAGRLTNLFSPPNPVPVGEKFLEDDLIHRTARGEAVRSKSEVVIANLLHAKGVDYRYEEALEIEGAVKYPDFTIEDDDTGEVYYWEHLGMLSNMGYRRRWEEKKEWFRRRGILPMSEGGGPEGTLIITRDSDKGGIDSEEVAKIVSDLFGDG